MKPYKKDFIKQYLNNKIRQLPKEMLGVRNMRTSNVFSVARSV